MRDRALRLLIPTCPQLVLGIVVVVALIVGETLADYPERPVAPKTSLGFAFLPGLLAVWTGRVGELAVASVDALLRAARARAAMGSALAR